MRGRTEFIGSAPGTGNPGGDCGGHSAACIHLDLTRRKLEVPRTGFRSWISALRGEPGAQCRRVDSRRGSTFWRQVGMAGECRARQRAMDISSTTVSSATISCSGLCHDCAHRTARGVTRRNEFDASHRLRRSGSHRRRPAGVGQSPPRSARQAGFAETSGLVEVQMSESCLESAPSARRY